MAIDIPGGWCGRNRWGKGGVNEEFPFKRLGFGEMGNDEWLLGGVVIVLMGENGEVRGKLDHGCGQQGVVVDKGVLEEGREVRNDPMDLEDLDVVHIVPQKGDMVEGGQMVLWIVTGGCCWCGCGCGCGRVMSVELLLLLLPLLGHPALMFKSLVVKDGIGLEKDGVLKGLEQSGNGLDERNGIGCGDVVEEGKELGD